MTHSTLQVFFDSRCPLCSREIRYYQRLAPEAAVEWVDIFNAEDSSLPASREALLKVIHGRTVDGALIMGVDVFVAMWQRLPGVWPLLSRVVNLPVIKTLTVWVYSWFAKRRFSKLYCDLS